MTLNLPLLYVLWLEEYCQIRPNKNKSPNLWHITSILNSLLYFCVSLYWILNLDPCPKYFRSVQKHWTSQKLFWTFKSTSHQFLGLFKLCCTEQKYSYTECFLNVLPSIFLPWILYLPFFLYLDWKRVSITFDKSG